MKFDVTMAMMLGVVGLGAFAVYEISKSKGSTPAPPEDAAAPNERLPLVQGVHYQGRLVLHAIDVPPLTATKDQLTQFLQVMGFRDVAVYMTPGELPFNWSELRTGGASNRWFEGTWNNGNVVLPRPKQVDRLAGNGMTLISGMTG